MKKIRLKLLRPHCSASCAARHPHGQHVHSGGCAAASLPNEGSLRFRLGFFSEGRTV